MKEEYFEYLDTLRETGVTNMWGAPDYLAKEFDISVEEAQEITSEWMRNFKKS